MTESATHEPMTGLERLRAWTESGLVFDRQAVGLAVLLLVVLVPATALAVLDVSTYQPETFGLEGAALGGAWAVLEVAVAAGLLVAIYLLRKLPAWIREFLASATLYVVLMLLGALGVLAEMFWPAAGVYLALVFVLTALIEYDVWWVANNVLVIGLAIGIGALGATAFNVEALIVAFVALSLYDWYFADKKSWMLTLGGTMVKNYLPVMFVVPPRWRFDWEDFAEALEADPDTLDAIEEAEATEDEANAPTFAIGTADLLLPAMFAAAVATDPGTFAIGGVPVAVIGVAVGVAVACFRLRWKMLELDGGAGLPPLAMGAVGGWAAVAGPIWVATLV